MISFKTRKSGQVPIAPAIDHNGAHERVTFYDSDNPKRNMTALFNPDSLPRDTEAVLGELNPIGASSSVFQYAFTRATEYDITLPYSHLALIERGGPMVRVEEAEQFFRSFLYGPRRRRAPSTMWMIWQNFLSVQLVVRRVSIVYSRWDLDLQVRDYEINLSVAEIRRDFMTSGSVLRAEPAERTIQRAIEKGVGRLINALGATGAQSEEG
jgi:hypothetical protein